MQQSTLSDTSPSVIDINVGHTRYQRSLSAPDRIVDRPDRSPMDKRVLTPQPAVIIVPSHDHWAGSSAADNIPPIPPPPSPSYAHKRKPSEDIHS